MSDIRGKVALITGGSRGIGRGISVALAENEATVAVNYHKNQEAAEETCEAIQKRGGRTVAIRADVSSSQDVSRMVQETEKAFGTIQILVNNAGVVHKDTLENLTEADWDRVMAINLKSAFLVTQAVLPGMREKQWGRIINLSSVAAQTGGVTGPIYVASKAGILGLTHSYASLLVKEGITANTIAPALIETDMVTKDLKASPDPIPMGRFGTVEEVSDVAVMLAKNGYIIGQTINVNGGWYYS
jgi:3-oxoacyl-[acyl-carrier protein] reductase